MPKHGEQKRLTSTLGQAAEGAGIHPVIMIKEPEAAALYAAKSFSFALQANDAFVVCDAGGGTVDLISYEVEAIRPILQVKELVPGTGIELRPLSPCAHSLMIS